MFRIVDWNLVVKQVLIETAAKFGILIQVRHAVGHQLVI